MSSNSCDAPLGTAKSGSLEVNRSSTAVILNSPVVVTSRMLSSNLRPKFHGWKGVDSSAHLEIKPACITRTSLSGLAGRFSWP